MGRCILIAFALVDSIASLGQIIGQSLENRTSLKLAELIEAEFGGFVPPPCSPHCLDALADAAGKSAARICPFQDHAVAAQIASEETDNYVMLPAINLVNCIAFARFPASTQ
jgi:hypothetical protein